MRGVRHRRPFPIYTAVIPLKYPRVLLLSPGHQRGAFPTLPFIRGVDLRAGPPPQAGSDHDNQRQQDRPPEFRQEADEQQDAKQTPMSVTSPVITPDSRVRAAAPWPFFGRSNT